MTKWYDNKWTLWVSLILCWPFGLYGLIKRREGHKKLTIVKSFVLASIFWFAALVGISCWYSTTPAGKAAHARYLQEQALKQERAKEAAAQKAEAEAQAAAEKQAADEQAAKEQQAQQAATRQKQQQDVKDYCDLMQGHLKNADENWQELWGGAANDLKQPGGTYAAYHKLSTLHDRQLSLDNQIRSLAIPDGLDEQTTADLKKAQEAFSDCMMVRLLACDNMRDALDNGHLSPSKADDIKSELKTASADMMDGMAHLMAAKQGVGIKTN